MKILINTNIVLDFLLQREPFFPDAARLFQAIGQSQVNGYITATTLTDIFYLARRHTQGLEKARQAVSLVLTALDICAVDRPVLEAAFTSELTDFEDAVQIFSALAQNLDAIVTRNVKDFRSSPLPIYAPADLLRQL